MRIIWKENIKKFLIEDIDKNKSRKMFSILIWKPIVYYLWDEFADEYMNKRVKNGIFLKSLRLTEKSYDKNNHKNYSWYNKEIKHTDSSAFRKNIFLYDNKVLVFDIDKFEIDITNSKKKFEEYIEKFNTIWTQNK